MTNKHNLENRYPTLQGEIKNGEKKIPFTFVGYNLNCSISVNKIVYRMAGLIDEDWFLIKLSGKTKVQYLSCHSETLVTGSFKQDGVEMVICYPKPHYIDSQQTCNEFLIEEIQRLYNIKNDKVVRRREAIIPDKCTGESDCYEILGEVVKEDDKLTITYKDGSVIVLSDFAIIGTNREINQLRHISKEDYENNLHYRFFEDEIPF